MPSGDDEDDPPIVKLKMMPVDRTTASETTNIPLLLFDALSPSMVGRLSSGHGTVSAVCDAVSDAVGRADGVAGRERVALVRTDGVGSAEKVTSAEAGEAVRSAERDDEAVAVGGAATEAERVSDGTADGEAEPSQYGLFRSAKERQRP